MKYLSFMLEWRYGVVNDKLIHDERMRIWEGIQTLYSNSERTRTPIYQDRMYEYMRTLVWPAAQHPPERFRDKSNGE